MLSESVWSEWPHLSLCPLVPNEARRRTILEYSAIYVTFASVRSHSVRVEKLWPKLWPENDRGFKTLLVFHESQNRAANAISCKRWCGSSDKGRSVTVT